MANPSRLAGLRAAGAKIGLPAWFIAIDLLWIAKLGRPRRSMPVITSARPPSGWPGAILGSSRRVVSGTARARTPALLCPDQPVAAVVSVGLSGWRSGWRRPSGWSSASKARSGGSCSRRSRMPSGTAIPSRSARPGDSSSPGRHGSGRFSPSALKFYAAIPLVFRPKQLRGGRLAMLVTLPLPPVGALFPERSDGRPVYFRGPGMAAHGGSRSSSLRCSSGSGSSASKAPSGWRSPLCGRRPSSTTSAMALPSVVAGPSLAAALALPMPLMTPAIVVLDIAALEVRRDQSVLRPAIAVRQT